MEQFHNYEIKILMDHNKEITNHFGFPILGEDFTIQNASSLDQKICLDSGHLEIC